MMCNMNIFIKGPCCEWLRKCLKCISDEVSYCLWQYISVQVYWANVFQEDEFIGATVYQKCSIRRVFKSSRRMMKHQESSYETPGVQNMLNYNGFTIILSYATPQKQSIRRCLQLCHYCARNLYSCRETFCTNLGTTRSPNGKQLSVIIFFIRIRL